MDVKRMAILGLAMVTASPVDARNCRSAPDDAARVDRAVHSFFAALAKDDPTFERTVTKDFYAFELGKVINAAELFKLVEASHRAGRVINWGIGPMTVRVDCEAALATWDNRGSAGVPPNILPRRWLESAMLRRSPSGWRLEFLHSTVVSDTK